MLGKSLILRNEGYRMDADVAWISGGIAAGSAIFTQMLNMLGNHLKTRTDAKSAITARIWAKEDSEISQSKTDREERIKAFNEVLQVDGDHTIYIDLDESFDFSTVKYKNHVRPIIFKNFHLLTAEMRFVARHMDKLLKSDEYFSYEEWNTLLAQDYIKLIEMISDAYDNI